MLSVMALWSQQSCAIHSLQHQQLGYQRPGGQRPSDYPRLDRAGATWNCPDDLNPLNNRPECRPGWEMQDKNQWPFIQSPTVAVVHRNGDPPDELDVTRDVEPFLSGSSINYGWIIRKDNEGLSGEVNYSSREGRFPPELTLIVRSNPNPPVISLVFPGTGQPDKGFLSPYGHRTPVLSQAPLK